MTQPNEIFVTLSEDKRIVHLEIGTDTTTLGDSFLGPEELDTVIYKLGQLRAAMADEVPKTLPTNPIFKNATHDPTFSVMEQNGSKRSIFAVRHPGFGWLAFTVAKPAMAALALALAAQIGKTEAKELFVPKKTIIT